MRSAILGFVAGVAWLQTRASLPTQTSIWLLIAIAILLGLCARFVRRFNVKIPLSIVCGATVGFIWAGLFAQHFLAEELPKEWEGRDVTVIGTIDSLPVRFEQGVRFNFQVERVLDEGGISPVTRDYINPEAAWPHIETLAKTCHDEGFTLTERLAIYDEYIERPDFFPARLRPLALAPGALGALGER